MGLPPDIHDHVSSLKATGECFAVATVVRTVSVTAAKAGAKAIVKADGTIGEGWIGGGCARAAVVKAAREAIVDGIPRLVSIQPEDLLEEHGIVPGDDRNGVRYARNMCPSKGTMDIFVEPVMPRPELVICGTTPVAQALAALSGLLGFSRTVCADAAGQALFPDAERRMDDFTLATNEVRERYIVIATQGSGDRAALKAALAAESRYVGFVGSRRKVESLKKQLAADDNVPESLFSKLKAPAGLDLKAIAPEEIALSILAEIVRLRRNRQNDTVGRDR